MHDNARWKYRAGHVAWAATACAVWLFTPQIATARGHSYFLSAEARSIPGGRTVHVRLDQPFIYADSNDIPVQYRNSLLAVFIAAAAYGDPAAAASNLRSTLAQFDARSIAFTCAKSNIEKVDWLGAKSIQLDDAGGDEAHPAISDTSPQTAIFNYQYDLSSDGSAIIVTLKVKIVELMPGNGPASSPKYGRSIYAQTLTSVTRLPEASKKKSENLDRWTANNARLAKDGIAAGLASASALIPRTINLTEADMDELTSDNHKYATIDDYMGQVEEDTPAGTLMFDTISGGFIYFSTLPQTP